MNVLHSQRNAPYAALLHKWADNLANLDINSRPHHQLLRPRRSATRPGFSDYGIDSYGRLFICLDILCCPNSQGKVKHSAISLMKRTYEDANCVFGLDSCLGAHDVHDICKLKAYTRVLKSP